MMLKKMLKLFSVLIVLGIIFPNLSLATKSSLDRKIDWQYYKDIQISGNPLKGELVKITLDQDVFNNSQKDLSDLRIVVDSSFDVPYKLIVESGTFSQKNIYPALVLNNSYNAEDGYNIFIVDFGQGGFLNSSLNIITSSENFKRSVEISGGNDMASWNIIRSNGYIYDYTDRVGNFKAQNTVVDYSENAYRYIQVKIFTGNEVPLVINGAQISKITKKQRRETILKPPYEIKENFSEKITEVVIDLGKKGWPTSNIKIDSLDENFNREVVIYESSDKTNWQSVGQDYIFNYNTPKFIGSNLDVNYRETSKRYLKIEIFNGDNKPISVNGISVKTILRSIVFQCEVDAIGSSYQLYYGNSKADFPQYDLELFFTYLDTGKYSSSSLSNEKLNSFYQKKVPPPLPLSERIPYLVPGVLVLAILMMSSIVFKFIKKVKTDK